MPRHPVRVGIAVVSLSLLATSCGLKEGAVQSLRSTREGQAGPASTAGGAATGGTATGGTATGGATGTATPGTASAAGGASTGAGSTVSTSGTGAVATSTGGAPSTGDTGGGPKATTRSEVGGCAAPSGGNTTGITSSVINIGLHAPLTGTGTPFPNNSFKAGAGIFWDQPGHTICGRKVQVDFQDDTYKPSGAHAVCQAMAKRDFIVIGGGGTDQIQACATDSVIQSTGTPYLSAGVTTNGLRNLGNYFAISLTYEQQGTLVVRNAKAQGFAVPKGSNKKWAIVTANTPNFDDATAGIVNALKAAGLPYQVFRQDQNGNYQAAATQFGQNLALQGFQTIYVDLAPGYFVFMAGGYYSVDNTGSNVMWTGPGVTFTEVTVAQYLCDGTKNQINGHAEFLAPAPGIDRATADFKKAYNNNYDDIEWSLWGASQKIYEMLKAASGDLTRQNFMATIAKSRFPDGVYPALDYATRGHFGGTGAWVQKVNCNETEPNQRSGGSPGQWDTVGDTYLKL